MNDGGGARAVAVAGRFALDAHGFGAHADFANPVDGAETTQPGRAAKVRALIIHVLRTEWRGPGRDLDWEIEMPRKLLGEFAGMTEEELANV